MANTASNASPPTDRMPPATPLTFVEPGWTPTAEAPLWPGIPLELIRTQAPQYYALALQTRDLILAAQADANK